MDMKKYTIGETFDLQEYMKDLKIEYYKRKKNNENKERKENIWN